VSLLSGLGLNPGESSLTKIVFVIRQLLTWVLRSEPAVFNVLDYGAIADGNGGTPTDNATAFTTCYNDLVANNGGVMYIPKGHYSMSSFPAITTDGVTILGDGRDPNNGTILIHSADGNFISATNATYLKIANLEFNSSIRKTTGFVIVITTCFQTSLTDIRIDNCFDGIHLFKTNGCYMDVVEIRGPLGSRGIILDGDNTARGAGLIMRNVLCDQGYSLGVTSIKTWAISTHFNAGDVVITNGRVYQCSTAGTSANAGTGPSGLPSGTTPDSAFVNTITDGTCQWKFCFDGDLTWLEMGSYAATITIVNAALLEGFRGVLISDAANTGSSFPLFFTAFDMELDHNLGDCMLINAGESFLIADSFISGSLQGRGILTGAAVKGEISLTGNTIGSNWLDGVYIVSGPQRVSIVSNVITTNNIGGTGSAGIFIDNGAKGVAVVANSIGNASSESQAYGINIAAGAGGRLLIADNVITNNTTANMSVGALSGTDNRIHNNIGYNPVGVTGAANVGTSPATITAGPTPETHYLKQTATNTATVAKGGQQVAALINASTYYVVELGPNESYVVTWVTTQPTYTKDVH